MSISMFGHIDSQFDSQLNVRFVPVVVSEKDGFFQEKESSPISYTATVQPLKDKELSYLGIGLERIQDYRKIYINSGDLTKLATLTGYIEMMGERWKPISVDVRINRDYCRLIVVREDE